MKNNAPSVLTTAIFDMDGLLLNTEPLWLDSMLRIAAKFGLDISTNQLKYTRGLRIYEVTQFWQHHFPWPENLDAKELADHILDDIIALAKQKGNIMPGVKDCLHLLKSKQIKIGLATSSPMRMVKELIPYFGLENYFDSLTSADTVTYGKPHPEVFLQCAEKLGAKSWECIVFEDSVNGMVAGKAAQMKVVVIPESTQFEDVRFGLADLKLSTMQHFNESYWHQINSLNNID